MIAFHAKDSLLVVDDFAPSGNSTEVNRLHREAARLFRAQGNRSGRQRLARDSSLRVEKPPRGLILSTGEDVPKAHSIRSRLLVIEVSIGSMDWGLLTACQTEAVAGCYAQAMGGYVGWMANRYDEARTAHRQRVQELRQQVDRSGRMHRRTPSMVAELIAGFECFLRFATEVGALAESEVERLRDRCQVAFRKAADAQVVHLRSEDPVKRFIQRLASALASSGVPADAPPHGTLQRGCSPNDSYRAARRA